MSLYEFFIQVNVTYKKLNLNIPIRGFGESRGNLTYQIWVESPKRFLWKCIEMAWATRNQQI